MSLQDKRNHKIKCHHGMNSYYKHYKETTKNPISKQLYTAIVKEFLNDIRDEISTNGYTFKLPQRLGKIELRKSKRTIKFDKEGNLINNLSINWKETNKLWKENLEAKIKKTKVRYTNEHTDGYVYKLVYLKYIANFKNKSLYTMSLNREMRRATAQPIINHKIDAFLLNS